MEKFGVRFWRLPQLFKVLSQLLIRLSQLSAILSQLFMLLSQLPTTLSQLFILPPFFKNQKSSLLQIAGGCQIKLFLVNHVVASEEVFEHLNRCVTV